MKITWLGHAAFLIEGKDTILVDPFLSGNPHAAVKPEDIKCDIIAVTHGHSDHLGDAVKISKRCKVPVVAIAELSNFLSQKGVESLGMNFGGTIKVKNTTITMVPAWHSAGIGEAKFGHSGGTAAGLIINSGKKVYHMGDTCLFLDLKLIGELYTPDVMMVPVGGLYTMNIKTAAMAVEWVKPEIAIPMHYNTWPIIEADPNEFASEVASRCSSKVEVMNVGWSLEL